MPRTFPLADVLWRRLAPPYPCSRGAFPTICTRLFVQGWRSTPNKSIPNKRSCCWSPQVRPRRRLVLVLRQRTAAGQCSHAGRSRATRTPPQVMILGSSSIYNQRRLSPCKDRPDFLRARVREVASGICGCVSCVAAIELVGMGSPVLASGETIQSSFIVTTRVQTKDGSLQRTLAPQPLSPCTCLGRGSHIR